MNFEAENDKIIQLIACTQKSAYSNKKAECGHHYIRRSDYLWRWEVRNIIPLTIEEHTRLHAGNIKEEELLRDDQRDFKLLKHLSLKNFLIDKGWSFKEFCKVENEKLKKCLQTLQKNPNMTLKQYIDIATREDLENLIKTNKGV